MSNYDDDYDDLDTAIDVDIDLAEACVDITQWWMEDYPFEDLLEEFDVLPEEALYACVKTGLIDEEDLKNYLTSDR
jgi:hypothetical protein